MFQVLLALYLFFFIVALIFKKGAIAAECLLVLQLAYLLLLDQQPLLEAKAGLQKTGKYTFGFNVALLNTYYLDDLLALDLDSNAANSLGITFIVTLLVFTCLAVLMLIRNCLHKQEH